MVHLLHILVSPRWTIKPISKFLDTSVLLATYDNAKCLRSFQINITFTKTTAPDQTIERVKATMELKALAYCSNITPLPADPYGNDGSTAAGITADQYALTHLEMISMVHVDPNSRIPPTWPTVFAVFSLIGPQYHGTSSIVCRWHLKEEQESTLLPVWEELPLKRNMGTIEPKVNIPV
jgi:hypothetical protein